MKHLFVISCLFLLTSVATISKTPLHVEAITIDMSNDLLIATSNDPNDPMKSIKIHNMSGQVVSQQICPQSAQCTHNLSNLAAGYYIAVAKSKYAQHSESIILN